jgi:hypothetical protein
MMEERRVIIVIFEETAFLWWAADQGEHPKSLFPKFRDDVRTRLQLYFGCQVIVKMGNEFEIRDTHLMERDVEEELNSMFFDMEEANGWESSYMLHS